MKTMTQSKMSRMVRLWRNRLGLIDWQITTELCTEEQLPDCWGMTLFDDDEYTATIRVRDCESIEAVVIHELIHLRLAPFSDGNEEEENHEAREKAIDLLAGAFLAAYPRSQRKVEKGNGENNTDEKLPAGGRGANVP